MKKSFVVAACALSLAAVPALAQVSQGKGGAENGPTSNSVTTNDSGPRGGAGAGGSAATGTHSGSGTVGAGTGSPAPSSSGNVGPGTNNNNDKQPGGR